MFDGRVRMGERGHYTWGMDEERLSDVGIDVEDGAAGEPAGLTRLIVGMSRAGTTWVTKELSRHPSVISYGETMVWGRKYLETDMDEGRDSAIRARERVLKVAEYIEEYVAYSKVDEMRERYDSGKLGHIPVETLELIAGDLRELMQSMKRSMAPAEVFHETNRVIGERCGAEVVIESTPNHLNFLDRIFGAMPDALVVVMLRGPYAFMVSYKHQGDRKHPDTQRTFRRLYHPMICAMLWRRYAKSAREAIKDHTGQVRTVWLDQLKKGGNDAMVQLAKFLEIPNAEFFAKDAERKSATNTSFPGGKRPVLSEADMFWMNLVAGGEMKRHGLTKTPAGFHPFAVLGSVLKLPISAFWVVWIMSSRIEGSRVGYAKRILFGK
tara:strand:+ start:19609 stop:20751 length:1143 start_codon:yes stop_codon:yes gene_type:complete